MTRPQRVLGVVGLFTTIALGPIALFGGWHAQSVWAEARRPLDVVLGSGSHEAVVLAHDEYQDGYKLVIERSYVGDFEVGERLPITQEAYEKHIRFGVGPTRLTAPPKYLLCLYRTEKGPAWDDGWLGNGWRIDKVASRRIVGDRVYVWWLRRGGALEGGDRQGGLVRDETLNDLGSLEDAIARGLAMRTRQP